MAWASLSSSLARPSSSPRTWAFELVCCLLVAPHLVLALQALEGFEEFLLGGDGGVHVSLGGLEHLEEVDKWKWEVEEV